MTARAGTGLLSQQWQLRTQRHAAWMDDQPAEVLWTQIEVVEPGALASGNWFHVGRSFVIKVRMYLAVICRMDARLTKMVRCVVTASLIRPNRSCPASSSHWAAANVEQPITIGRNHHR